LTPRTVILYVIFFIYRIPLYGHLVDMRDPTQAQLMGSASVDMSIFARDVSDATGWFILVTG
jgi:hypothetical protein